MLTDWMTVRAIERDKWHAPFVLGIQIFSQPHLLPDTHMRWAGWWFMCGLSIFICQWPSISTKQKWKQKHRIQPILIICWYPSTQLNVFKSHEELLILAEKGCWVERLGRVYRKVQFLMRRIKTMDWHWQWQEKITLGGKRAVRKRERERGRVAFK